MTYLYCSLCLRKYELSVLFNVIIVIGYCDKITYYYLSYLFSLYKEAAFRITTKPFKL